MSLFQHPRLYLAALRHGLKFCVPMLTFVLLAGAQTPQFRVGEVIPSVDLATYHQVLDLAFARPPEIRGGVIFSLTVRFLPSFGKESQVTATFFDGNRARVDYEIAQANIYDASSEILRTTTENRPTFLVTRIAPLVRSVPDIAPERLLAWQEGLFRSVGPTLSGLRNETIRRRDRRTFEITLDGTAYEICYREGVSEFHWSVGPSVTGRGTAGWAERLLAEVTQNSKR
jgi:hypothetical protein